MLIVEVACVKRLQLIRIRLKVRLDLSLKVIEDVWVVKVESTAPLLVIVLLELQVDIVVEDASR